MPRTVRDIAIVLILMGGGLIILFSSSGEGEAGPLSSILHAVLRPVQVVVWGVSGRARGVWNDYLMLVGVRKENKTLREEIENLEQERASLLSKERENRRLKKLLRLKEDYEFPSVVAGVIGEDAVGWYRSFFINRGSDDGVAAGMAATVAAGVVGRITRSSATVSKVLLITDPDLSLDCRVGRTRDRGILSGQLNGMCILRYVGLQSEMKPGDDVVTSGLGGIFPKGLRVGVIESVHPGSQGLFLEAIVAPAVDFSTVEEVLVILRPRGGFDIGPGLEAGR